MQLRGNSKQKGGGGGLGKHVYASNWAMENRLASGGKLSAATLFLSLRVYEYVAAISHSLEVIGNLAAHLGFLQPSSLGWQAKPFVFSEDMTGNIMAKDGGSLSPKWPHVRSQSFRLYNLISHDSLQCTFLWLGGNVVLWLEWLAG